MESIDSSTITAANGVHTYATLNQVERRESTLAVSITNELYSGNGNRTNGTAVVNGNGSNQPSVGIYEQPVFSQSQYEPSFNVSRMMLFPSTCTLSFGYAGLAISSQ